MSEKKLADSYTSWYTQMFEAVENDNEDLADRLQKFGMGAHATYEDLFFISSAITETVLGAIAVAGAVDDAKMLKLIEKLEETNLFSKEVAEELLNTFDEIDKLSKKLNNMEEDYE